tara:strand:+ start:153 stop:356 length:204 start_codon:yes stop_codon:yes gene_type:complete
MGNLKGTLFTGIVGRDERLDKQSIKLLNITYVEILAAFFSITCQTKLIHHPYTVQTNTTQQCHTTKA